MKPWEAYKAEALEIERKHGSVPVEYEKGRRTYRGRAIFAFPERGTPTPAIVRGDNGKLYYVKGHARRLWDWMDRGPR